MKMDKNIRLSDFCRLCTVILICCLFTGCKEKYTMRDAQEYAEGWVNSWYDIENQPVAKSITCYISDEVYMFEIVSDYYQLDLFTGEINEELGLVTEKLVYAAYRNPPDYTTIAVAYSLDQSYTYGGPEWLVEEYEEIVKNYKSKYVYKEDELVKFIHPKESYKEALEEFYN